MKIDNIYRTIVGIAPELRGEEVREIREYIELLLEDEVNSYKERISDLEVALSNLLRYTRACEDLLNASESAQCKNAAILLEQTR